jgi:hypothetical protein
MRRVLMFSTKFPEDHPLRGNPTFFPEKILKREKIHTIRAGYQFNDGDTILFRYWKDKPYRSKQVEFRDPAIVSVQKIKMEWKGLEFHVEIDGKEMGDGIILKLSKNDGLAPSEFIDWFTKGKAEGRFEGQIRHWTDFKY